MASESSEEHKTIEERIAKLKQDTEKYDKLEDTVKIQQSEQYNQMIVEKEACEELLTKYKNMLTTDSKKKRTVYFSFSSLLIQLTSINAD